MIFLPRRAVSSADSFMRFARSAPVKPGVSLATFARSTSVSYTHLAASCAAVLWYFVFTRNVPLKLHFRYMAPHLRVIGTIPVSYTHLEFPDLFAAR